MELHETMYAYFNMSEILFLKGDYPQAVDALQKASQLDAKNENKEAILSKLYKIYYYTGNHNKLQETFNELKKLNPDYRFSIPEKKKYVFYLPVQVENELNQALSLYRSQKLDAALKLFSKTLEVKETALANRCIGDILFSRNDSSAIVYYQKAYPDYKNDTDFLKNLCLIHIQQKQINRAKSVLEEIRKLDPDSKNIPLLETYISPQNG